MVTVLPASQLAYVLSVLALITGVMTGVAALLDMVPFLENNASAFNWTVRAINFVLNLAAIIAVEIVILHAYSNQNLIAYILTAAGSTGVSHVLYTVITARKQTKLDDAHAYIAELHAALAAPAPVAAPAATVQDGKNAAASPS